MKRPLRRFAFRLSLALGIAHPDILLGQISARQLNEWLAYDSIDPIGSWRADLRAGIIASTVANAHIAKGKRTKPQDFMPKFQKPEIRRTQTSNEKLELARQIAAAFGVTPKEPK
jgi:hypothetical protein